MQLQKVPVTETMSRSLTNWSKSPRSSHPGTSSPSSVTQTEKRNETTESHQHPVPHHPPPCPSNAFGMQGSPASMPASSMPTTTRDLHPTEHPAQPPSAQPMGGVRIDQTPSIYRRTFTMKVEYRCVVGDCGRLYSRPYDMNKHFENIHPQIRRRDDHIVRVERRQETMAEVLPQTYKWYKCDPSQYELLPVAVRKEAGCSVGCKSRSRHRGQVACRTIQSPTRLWEAV
jgi:hypothetical protein